MEVAGTSVFFLPEVNSRVPFWTVSVPVAVCFTPSSPRTCLVWGKVPGCCAAHGLTRNIATIAIAPINSPVEVLRIDTSCARITHDCAYLALYDPELQLRLVHRTLLRPGTQQIRLRCRRKMRMSGLCKVEMSAFMGGRGAHGDGANGLESTRTGSHRSVARSTARTCNPGGRGETITPVGSTSTPAAVGHRQAGRPSRGPWTMGPAIEPQVGPQLRTEGVGAGTPAVCRFRTHVSRRTLGRGRIGSEPGDASEVDDPRGLLAAAQPAREKDLCVAGAQSQFWRAGDAG